MLTQTLTGKTRYRVVTRMFSHPLLVLQVEIHETGIDYGSHPTDLVRDVDKKYFIDANVTHLTLNEFSICK